MQYRQDVTDTNPDGVWNKKSEELYQIEELTGDWLYMAKTLLWTFPKSMITGKDPLSDVELERMVVSRHLKLL